MSNFLLFSQPGTNIPNISSIPTKHRCFKYIASFTLQHPWGAGIRMWILEITKLSPKDSK